MNKKTIVILSAIAIISVVAIAWRQYAFHARTVEMQKIVDQAKMDSERAINDFDRKIDMIQSTGPSRFGTPAYESRQNRR